MDQSKCAGINLDMLVDWSDILPATIESLSPLHRDILMYVMNVPGKRRPTYRHAVETWNLDREQFEAELEAACEAIRLYLRRYGLNAASDLDSR